MDLSAIIVSYNVRNFLTQTVLTLFRAAQGLQMEVIVVDNNSVDDSVAFLREKFAEKIQQGLLTIVENRENMGFGRANNQGLALAKGDYVVYVNPDTLIGEATLRQCVDFLRTHEEAGAVGVRMLHRNGRFALESRRGTPTPFTSFCKMSGLTSLFPHSRVFGRYYLRYLDEHQVCPVDIVSGAFMMAARAVLNSVGGFDEQFFMYGEDIDLSYRIARQGRQNYYIPARILHYKGESTNKGSRRYVNRFYQAMAIFFRKHYCRAFWLWLPVYAGIYMMSFAAVVKQQCKRLKNWLSSRKHPPKMHCWLVGGDAMQQRAVQWREERHITGTYLPKDDFSFDRLSTERRNESSLVLFDMDEIRTDEILAIFDSPGHECCYIGTYFPQEELMIPELR